jgi:hypothetical protein
MKWSDRIAQDFNPGLVGITECPESGTRPMSAAGQSTMLVHTTLLGRHFQGVPIHVTSPRAKAPGLFC